MTDITDYGVNAEMISEQTGNIARVCSVHKERYGLISEFGECFGRLKSGVYFAGDSEEFPTVGDFVLIRHNPAGDSQIIKTLERRTFFSRREPGPIPKDQAVAANFDYVFIIQSLNHDFNIKRLERYLTLAWQSGAVPVVVLTKADLIPDPSEILELAKQSAGDVRVVAVSAKTGFGLSDLTEYLKPRNTIVFLGSSGVGKSSLLNALAGSELMAVSDIREDDSKGRHTTTHRQLIMLSCGAMIIDTPGMRELGMWDVTDGLGETFSDVEQYFGLCKYSDCGHGNEPGCAVRAAITRGELSPERWENYQKIGKEARYYDDKAIFMRERQARGKEIAKWNKQRKKTSKKR